MGGDILANFAVSVESVSIHAPTWGATPPCSASSNSCRCFNPRPHMGGDTARTKLLPLCMSFNPRPHMGGDTTVHHRVFLRRSFNPRPHMGGDVFQEPLNIKQYVSIHAPTWGATPLGCWYGRSRLRFNPRPHMGGDNDHYNHHDDRYRFNPRPHMGGDPHERRGRTFSRCFNPRPHMGGDGKNFKVTRIAGVSIHAPTWGATVCSKIWRLNLKFQSTPPHGGRRASRRTS